MDLASGEALSHEFTFVIYVILPSLSARNLRKKVLLFAGYILLFLPIFNLRLSVLHFLPGFAADFPGFDPLDMVTNANRHFNLKSN